APAYVANLDRARLIARCRRKTQDVNGERQVGAWSPGDARYLLNGMTVPNEDVVKSRQELEQIFGQHIRPDFGDETCRLAAALAPVGDRRKRIQFIGVAEHRKKEVEVTLQDHLVARVRCELRRKLGRPGCQAYELV